MLIEKDLEKETKNLKLAGKKRRKSEIDRNNDYYFKKESKKLLRAYGPFVIQFALKLDENSGFPNLLKKHKVESKFRTKLVDWLFEVFNAINCSDETIFLTVHIMDKFFYYYKEKQIKDEDIHLIGVSCLFIASKFEDIIPLRMEHVLYQIAHSRFTHKELKTMEKKILNTLNFTLIYHSMLDFLKTYFYEFRITNKSFVLVKQQQENFDLIEKYSLYVSKMILHHDEFSTYKNSIKSIVCIIIGFEVVRTYRQMETFEIDFIKKWILEKISSSNYNPDDINELYNTISDFYVKFGELSIAHNLLKSANLPF